MRNEQEIAKAHDILDSLLEGDIPFSIADDNHEHQEEIMIIMDAVRRTLCWVLQHKKGEWLEERITDLEAQLFGKGIIFHEKDSTS